MKYLTIAVGAVVAGLIGFAVVAWRPPIEEITPPKSSAFSAEAVSRGGSLVGAGFCVTCHAAKAGRSPVVTPITPEAVKARLKA